MEHQLVGLRGCVGCQYGRVRPGAERDLGGWVGLARCWVLRARTLWCPASGRFLVCWGAGRALVVVEPLLSLWGWW